MRIKYFFIHGYVGEFLLLATQPLIVILLSYFLTTEEYGIMGILLILITIFTVIFDRGINQYLIYCEDKDLTKSLFNVVVLNTTTVLIIGVVAWIFLPNINSLLKINIDKISTLQYLIACAFYLYSSSLSTILLKKFKTKNLIFPKLLRSIGPGIGILILLGSSEFTRLYTLCHLISSLLVFIILFYHTIPLITITKNSLVFEINKPLKYSVWIILDGIGVWFITWFDHLMLSINQGLEVTGKYRLALSLSSFAFAISISPLIGLLMPYLKKKSLISEQKKIVILIIKWITLLVITVSVLAIFNTEFVLKTLKIDVLKWGDLDTIIILIILQLGFGWIVAPFQELYKVIGKTKLIATIMYIQLIIFVPFYIFATKLNFSYFMWYKLLLIISTIFLHNYYAQKILKINLFSLLKEFLPIIMISLFLIIVNFSLKNIIDVNSILVEFGLSLIFIACIVTIHQKQIKSLIKKFIHV